MAQPPGRPGFSFLLCPDPELIRQRLDALVAEHGQGRPWERRVHWGDEELPGSFWADLTVPDLMGTPRLVVVRRAHKLLKETWDKLTQPLGSFNAAIWPVFCLEAEADRKGPKPPAVLVKTRFWPVAEKRGWVWTSPGLTPQGMEDFVRAHAARAGLTVAPDTLRALCQALPCDALGAKNELDKIALAAAPGGAITGEHLGLVSFEAGMDVFAFIAAIIEGRRGDQVWKKVLDNRQASASDDIFFAFLSLLQREARLLWELASGEPPSAWMPPGAQRAKAEVARRVGPGAAARVFDLAMQAEFGVKTGQRSPEQAFEAMIMGLHAAFGAKSAPARR